MLYLRAGVGFLAPVIVDGVIPATIVRSDTDRFDLGVPRLAGLVLVVGGAWMLIDAVFLRFAREGRGTLVPIDPPRFVVRGGPYQLVRNPMYLANVAVITGTAVLFGSWHLVIWAAFVFLAFHTFVVLYEEPTLQRTFGDDYEAYRRRVPRWLPRGRGGPSTLR